MSAVIMWRHVGVGIADTRRATGPVLWRTNAPVTRSVRIWWFPSVVLGCCGPS